MPSRILIADPSLTTQRIIELIFTGADFEVTHISDGLEARERLNEINPDIVLASISLPGRNGYELCEDIKHNPALPDVPVILLVGGSEQFDEAEAFRVRADDWLANPPEERAVIETVRRLLADRKEAGTAGLTSFSATAVDQEKSEDSASSKLSQTETLPLVSNEERPREVLPGKPGEPPNQTSFFNKYIPPPPVQSLDLIGAQHKAAPPPALIKVEKEPRREPVSHEGAALVVWSLVACLVLGVIAIFVFLPLSSKDAIPNPHVPQADVGSSRAANDTAPPPVGEAGAEGEGGEVDVESESTEDTNPDEPPPTYSPEAAGDELDDVIVVESDKEIAPDRAPAARRRGQPLTDRAVLRANPRREFSPRQSDLVRSRLLRRARFLEETGNLDRAENQYRYILDRFPNEREGRLGLRRVEARKSQARREQTLKASRANREIGLSSFRSGNYVDAATRLNQAVNAGLRDTSVLYALGSSYLKLNRISEARAAFERCLAGNPNYAPALVGLARTHIAVGRRDQAVALLRRALELGGGAEYSPGRIREMISSLTGNSSGRTRR